MRVVFLPALLPAVMLAGLSACAVPIEDHSADGHCAGKCETKELNEEGDPKVADEDNAPGYAPVTTCVGLRFDERVDGTRTLQVTPDPVFTAQPSWIRSLTAGIRVRAGLLADKRSWDPSNGATTMEVGFHDELGVDLELRLLEHAREGDRLAVDAEGAPTYRDGATVHNSLALTDRVELSNADFGVEKRACFGLELWPITVNTASGGGAFFVEAILSDDRTLSFGQVRSGTTVYAVVPKGAPSASLRIGDEHGMAVSVVPGPGEHTLMADKPLLAGTESQDTYPVSVEIALADHLFPDLQYLIEGKVGGFESMPTLQLQPGVHWLLVNYIDGSDVAECFRSFSVPEQPVVDVVCPQ